MPDADGIEFEYDEGDEELDAELLDEFGLDPNDYENYGEYIKALIDEGIINREEADEIGDTISPSGSANVG